MLKRMAGRLSMPFPWPWAGWVSVAERGRTMAEAPTSPAPCEACGCGVPIRGPATGAAGGASRKALLTADVAVGLGLERPPMAGSGTRLAVEAGSESSAAEEEALPARFGVVG